MPVAVILADLFAQPPAGSQGEQAAPQLGDIVLEPVVAETALGQVSLYRFAGPQEAYVLFRRGWPRPCGPLQIPYEAQALALRALGVEALLLTAEVLLLDERAPLLAPMQLRDLVMPDNRLPDGRPCTIGTAPGAVPRRLELDEGLCSEALDEQVARLGAAVGCEPGSPVTLAYRSGARDCTQAEERFWVSTGAEAIGDGLGPDLVLANELGMVCAGIAIGTSYGRSLVPGAWDREQMDRDRRVARSTLAPLICAFLSFGEPVPVQNHLISLKR